MTLMEQRQSRATMSGDGVEMQIALVEEDQVWAVKPLKLNVSTGLLTQDLIARIPYHLLM